MPAYSLSPNDLQGGWCECEKCVAWDDPDPTVGLAARVLRFNNLVAKAMEEEFPDQHYLYYAEYSNMPGPPVRKDGTVAMKAHPAIIPIYVNMTCAIHDITDSSCPLNIIHRQLLDSWSRVAEQIYMYEWWMWTYNNPIPVHDIIGQRINYYHNHGMRGYYAELLGHSPDNTLSMYIAAKMLWDVDQDPKAILDDFFELYFQESAEPMGKYYRILGSDVSGAKKHGVRFLSRRPKTKFNIDLPIDVRRAKKLRRILDSAVALAKKPVVKRRLVRESKALRQYELDAKVELLFTRYQKKPTLNKKQALLAAMDNANNHYKQVKEILTYTGRRHWLNNINKRLPK